MKARKISNLISLLFVFALLLSSVQLCYAGTPIDMDAPLELTINLATDDGPIKGGHFSVWRIATTGSGGGVFTLTDEFTSSAVDINKDLTAEEAADTVTTLRGFIADKNIAPIGEAVTNDAGRAVVKENLVPGMYLIVGDSIRVGNKTIDPVPYLMQLPRRAKDDQWVYMTTSDPKTIVKIDPYSPTPDRPSPKEKTIDLTIKKVWIDDKDSHEPITVRVYDGKKLVKELQISAEDNWTVKVEKLAENGDYSVVEDVPEGYKVSINEEGTVFTITNTIPGEKPPVDPTPGPTDPTPGDDPTPPDVDDPPVTDDTPNTPSVPGGPGKNAQTGTYSYLVPIIGSMSAFILILGAAILKNGEESEA